MEKDEKGMLSPYRVLDLTDEKGHMCGRLLGDMGADVIKIESPGGDTARSIGPFYHDEPDPEKSLYWFALNANKRGITLNLESVDGREIFKKLVKTADFIIESYPVGYLDKLGLGYKDLETINPKVILVSITPFGQNGPHKDYKGSDIVAWAMSGQMYGTGDPDRGPLRISHHPQTYFSAGASAAGGALMALYQRHLTGEGQQVDMSIQEALTPYTFAAIARWDMEKQPQQRTGPASPAWLFETKDKGTSLYMITAAKGNPALVKWMDEEGMAPEEIKKVNWDMFNLELLSMKGTVEEKKAKGEAMQEPLLNMIRAFYKTHTKVELFEHGMQIGVAIYPQSTVKDMAEDVQLAFRKFWIDVEHPELGTKIKYPGTFAQTAEATPKITRRAPLIGEHNEEIYKKELGISKEKLVMLKESGAI
jgi:crotonobetainyl-CoA:carnitine CoA-transferase CaiB-like acyl-CoA transferase